MDIMILMERVVFTNEYNAFYDSNGDGIFDLRQINSQNKSDITKNDDYSFILNNSFELWFFQWVLNYQ